MVVSGGGGGLPLGMNFPTLQERSLPGKVLHEPSLMFHSHSVPSTVPASSACDEWCHSIHWGQR